MSQLIAVLGATGQQGGSVARACLKAGWKVRAITRDVNKGKALAEQGAEIVAANLDDEASLIKAFEGATAIFSVTNFWEHLFTGSSASESGTAEATQAFTVATAAAKTPTLQHFLFSTLPSASELSAGAHPVPHMDYKAAVDDRIRFELPELAEKTTFIWLGWYSSNMVSMPLIRPTEWGGKYLWIQPSRADALLPVSGDLSVNLGVFAVAALEHPEKTRGRYVNVRSEVLTFEQILRVWGEVAGREAVYVPVSKEVFERVWGPAGEEMALQYEFGEACGDWESMKKGEVCQPGEIGVTKDQLVDLRGHLMGLKARLL